MQQTKKGIRPELFMWLSLIVAWGAMSGLLIGVVYYLPPINTADNRDIAYEAS